ncbi:MAG TPA: transcriptional regulator [Hellea balneolensis]|uniref:Transcriptional regulator n=1 Tax=Hellea balneolensis TaxID=287478 RepID=A0A7C5QQH1_9PROT|nr:transcriptional regulator [Hellea balneolensis]
MSFSKLRKENSALVAALDLFGDKWTLLILAGCLSNMCRFNDLEKRLGINRNILSNRLDKLLTAGILEKHMYNEKPKRYEYHVTQAGLDTRPFLAALMHWSEHNLVSGKAPISLVHKECGNTIDIAIRCPSCNKNIDTDDIAPMLNPNAGKVSTQFFKDSTTPFHRRSTG